jgi:hypothetical protein
LLLACTVGFNRAAMQLYQMSHYGQSQTEAPIPSGRGGIGLAEPIKNARQELLPYALAVISYGDSSIEASLFKPDLYFSSDRRKLDRIG